MPSPTGDCGAWRSTHGFGPDAAYGGRTEQEAQGWYRDPYGVHEDRYLSAGAPTKLVRDGGSESYDEPPVRPLPDGALVSATSAADESGNGSDLRRADEASSQDPYSPEAAKRAAFDVWNAGWPI